MISRSAHADRQATIDLLESLRVELERGCRDLEAKYAAIPVLPAAQYDEGAGRILGMSQEKVSEFLRDYRARMTRMVGNRPFYMYYTRPIDTRHNDDPQMAEAIERVNLAARNHDEAMLDLRVAELFGGRVTYGRSEQRDRELFTLEVLGLLKSVAEKHRAKRSPKGADIQVRSPSKLVN